MLYDRAQARCLRLAAGLSVGEAAEFADIAERAVWRFETQRDPLPFYIDKLTQLLTTQDTVVDELVAGASAGAIRTYFRDDDTFTATEGRLPFASTHQVCAGRAAELIPGAVVVARREGDVDAAIPARAARIGLVGKTMARAMRISQNSARRWLGGLATMPAEVLQEFTDLETIAQAHRRDLTAAGGESVLVVSATQEDLEARWPALAPSDTMLGLDLAVHHTIAGQVAHAAGQSLAYAPNNVSSTPSS